MTGVALTAKHHVKHRIRRKYLLRKETSRMVYFFNTNSVAFLDTSREQAGRRPFGATEVLEGGAFSKVLLSLLLFIDTNKVTSNSFGISDLTSNTVNTCNNGLRC